ncbi:hypothetical protein RUE5091_00531 [Ruegeria denitrificans]|uniref:Uncharacterized protein n=1 Tax=Ruegeria denitrificans TaxID=1715692 RepID=A0A0P1I2J5_9RHOB|nr:hypothetical protein [Ruegeria denitrificans]CUJ86918.1 hypothetical protein RUE5091_00531 [Ruegeria denitrificans]
MPTRLLKTAFRISVALNRTVLTTLICLNICAAGALWIMPDSGQATMSATSMIFVSFFLAFVPVIVFCLAVFSIGVALRGFKLALPASLVFWTLFGWALLGRIGGFLDALTAVAIGALAGLVFWLLLAGVKHSSDVGGPKFLTGSRLDRLISAAFVVAGVFFLGKGMADRIETLFFSEDIAAPAFQDEYFRPLTTGERRAAQQFPTIDACVRPGLADGTLPELDWSLIHNSHEAKICVFRVLQLSKNVDEAADWLALQGLRVSRENVDGSPRKLPKGREGDYYIHAGRTIRRSVGASYAYTPLYQARTPLGQLFSLMAYGMTFYVYYKAGETRPYAVSISSSTV